MAADIKVSFIVPVFNVGKYLVRCMNSIVNQTLREIEIICVDDASTDDSSNILNRYAADDERIRILQSGSENKNMGQSVARNVGLKAARGEYVYMVDADDWVELNAAKELYEFAVKDDLDILYFGFYPEYEDEELKKKFEHLVRYNIREGACSDEIISGQAMIKLQMENNAIYGTIWSALFKTAFLHEQRLLFDEEIYCEDILFSFQAILNARRTKCVPGVYYHYYRRYSSQTTSKVTEKHLADRFTLAIKELQVAMSYNSLLPEFVAYIAKYIVSEFLFIQGFWDKNNEYIDEKKLFYSEPWKNLAFEIFRYTVRKISVLRKFTDYDIQRLEEAEYLIVYGAGYMGRKVLSYLSENGFNRVYVAVTHLDNEQYFMGNKVCEIGDLTHLKDESVVLVSVTAEKQREMVDTLKNLGFKKWICIQSV